MLEISETASDAWSTDVLASDTSERQSDRLLELDQVRDRHTGETLTLPHTGLDQVRHAQVYRTRPGQTHGV